MLIIIGGFIVKFGLESCLYAAQAQKALLEQMLTKKGSKKNKAFIQAKIDAINKTLKDHGFEEV